MKQSTPQPILAPSQSIMGYLKDSATYKTSIKQLIQRVKDGDRNVNKEICDTVQHCLDNEQVEPMQKLLAVKMAQDVMELKNIEFIKLFQNQCVHCYKHYAQYKKDVQSDDRGKSIFTDSKDVQLASVGVTFLRIIFESIRAWSMYFPYTPNTKTPSKFMYLYHELLVQQKVQFPGYVVVKQDIVTMKQDKDFENVMQLLNVNNTQQIDKDYKNIFQRIESIAKGNFEITKSIQDSIQSVIKDAMLLNDRIDPILQEVLESDEDLSMELIDKQENLQTIEKDWKQGNWTKFYIKYVHGGQQQVDEQLKEMDIHDKQKKDEDQKLQHQIDEDHKKQKEIEDKKLHQIEEDHKKQQEIEEKKKHQIEEDHKKFQESEDKKLHKIDEDYKKEKELIDKKKFGNEEERKKAQIKLEEDHKKQLKKIDAELNTQKQNEDKKLHQIEEDHKKQQEIEEKKKHQIEADHKKFQESEDKKLHKIQEDQIKLSIKLEEDHKKQQHKIEEELQKQQKIEEKKLHQIQEDLLKSQHKLDEEHKKQKNKIEEEHNKQLEIEGKKKHQLEEDHKKFQQTEDKKQHKVDEDYKKEKEIIAKKNYKTEEERNAAQFKLDEDHKKQQNKIEEEHNKQKQIEDKKLHQIEDDHQKLQDIEDKKLDKIEQENNQLKEIENKKLHQIEVEHQIFKETEDKKLLKIQEEYNKQKSTQDKQLLKNNSEEEKHKNQKELDDKQLIEQEQLKKKLQIPIPNDIIQVNKTVSSEKIVKQKSLQRNMALSQEGQFMKPGQFNKSNFGDDIIENDDNVQEKNELVNLKANIVDLQCSMRKSNSHYETQLKQIKDAYSQAIVKLNQYQMRTKQLEQEHLFFEQKASDPYKQLNQKYIELNKAFDNLKDDYEHEKSHHDKLKQEHINLNYEQALSVKELSHKQDILGNFGELKQSYTEHLTKYEKIRLINEDLKEENHQLKNEMKIFQKDHEYSNNLKQTQILSTTEKHQEEKVKLLSKNQQQEQQIQQQRMTIQQHQEQVNKLRLESQSGGEESQRSNVNEHKTKALELQDELEVHRETIIDLRRNLDETTKRHDRSSKEIDALRERYDANRSDLKRQLQSVRKELIKLQDEQHGLHSQLIESKARNADLEHEKTDNEIHAEALEEQLKLMNTNSVRMMAQVIPKKTEQNHSELIAQVKESHNMIHTERMQWLSEKSQLESQKQDLHTLGQNEQSQLKIQLREAFNSMHEMNTKIEHQDQQIQQLQDKIKFLEGQLQENGFEESKKGSIMSGSSQKGFNKTQGFQIPRQGMSISSSQKGNLKVQGQDSQTDLIKPPFSTYQSFPLQYKIPDDKIYEKKLIPMQDILGIIFPYSTVEEYYSQRMRKPHKGRLVKNKSIGGIIMTGQDAILLRKRCIGTNGLLFKTKGLTVGVQTSVQKNKTSFCITMALYIQNTSGSLWDNLQVKYDEENFLKVWKSSLSPISDNQTQQELMLEYKDYFQPAMNMTINTGRQTYKLQLPNNICLFTKFSTISLKQFKSKWKSCLPNRMRTDHTQFDWQMYGEIRKSFPTLIVINEEKGQDFDNGIGEMKLGGYGIFLDTLPFFIKMDFMSNNDFIIIISYETNQQQNKSLFEDILNGLNFIFRA